ncbi:MAG: spore germination protein [Clostridia bacterium]|nr:spore germination protein [Clostridia bacterium]
MNNDNVSSRLEKSMAAMDALLHRSVNPDMHRRLFRVFRREACVYFMEGVVSSDFLQHYLLSPLMKRSMEETAEYLPQLLAESVPLIEAVEAERYADAVREMMIGKAVVFVQSMKCAVCFDVRMFVRRGISPPLTESVVNGPHQGFNESIRDNITMIRRILPTPDLVGEMITVGDRYPTALSILYLKGVADEGSLERIRGRLQCIKADHVMSIGMLEQLLEDSPWSLMPQCCLTERPDRAASFLLEGQIVLALDGSPQILCMPVSILHLLHTPDDSSMRWQYGSFLRLIRLIGAASTILLPALFVAAVTFHPELLPVTLLTAILESQAAVPLSIPMEMLLMLLMFSLIGEAGIRVPGVAGSSLGTVSGLILGQAAVEAKLVHPLLIIVVAVASLGSYAVPDYGLGLACRILQLLFLGAASVFGLYGVVLLLGVGLIRLCAVRSLGSPYAAPLSPVRLHNPDTLMRFPVWMQTVRTWLASPEAMRRAMGSDRRKR